MKLAVQDLVVQYGYGRDALVAVDGVSIAIAAGQTLGLVGGSGCGKSTIARALVGLLPVKSGSVYLDDKDYTSQRARESSAYRRKVQMVFQDPFSSLNPRMSVAEALTEVMPRKTNRAAKRKEALRVLDLVQLPSNALERYPHQFSGGQRQRIAIARVLAVRPDVIVHDEVTSSLDVSVQATILNLLKDLQKELGLTYIFISHDFAAVRYMSDTIAVMYLGRVVENAEADQLLDSPQHPYTRILIQSIPKFGENRRPAAVAGDLPDPRHPPRGCRLHPICPIGPAYRPERAVCVDTDPQTITASQKHLAACHFAGERIDDPKTLLAVEKTLVPLSMSNEAG